jgi:hypothetical protein
MSQPDLTARLHASAFLLRVVGRLADGELSVAGERFAGMVVQSGDAPTSRRAKGSRRACRYPDQALPLPFPAASSEVIPPVPPASGAAAGLRSGPGP